MRSQLSRYLNDHLAGALVAEELARHCLGAEIPGELREWLREFIEALEPERVELMRVQRALGFRPSALKRLGAVVVGKLERIGANQQLVRRTPSTVFLQLEALSLGIERKHSLWLALADLVPAHPVLATFDFASLAQRAAEQRAAAERFRREAATRAFGGTAVQA